MQRRPTARAELALRGSDVVWASGWAVVASSRGARTSREMFLPRATRR